MIDARGTGVLLGLVSRLSFPARRNAGHSFLLRYAGYESPASNPRQRRMAKLRARSANAAPETPRADVNRAMTNEIPTATTFQLHAAPGRLPPPLRALLPTYLPVRKTQ